MPTDKKRKRTDDEPAPPVRRSPRKSAEEARKAQKEQAERDAEAKRLLFLEELRSEIRRRKPDPKGDSGDGNLYVSFVEVGQGDFAVLSTPGGKVILFDGGSLGTDHESIEGTKIPNSDADLIKRMRDVLADTKFLGQKNLIDILILSHPDGDHYNKLRKVLGNDYTIGKCYHSDSFGQYTSDKTSEFLFPRIGLTQQVVKNHDPGKVNGEVTLQGKPVQKKDTETNITVDRLDDDGGILIVDEGAACQISIIAAGVAHEYTNDGSDDTNRGSVVTLVQAHGQKLLMMGDATKNTEQFLLNTAKDRITGLDIVQIAHHGSVLTSSSQKFVNVVNPIEAIASSGRKLVKHRHPSKEVILRYVAKLKERPDIDKHVTYIWPPTGEGKVEAYESTKSVFSTGSRGTITRVFKASR
ncbi:ComEC/Rec2 family competence protein [Streptomyces sp. 3214.6]|uniref:ComEC/Rec2 family competence protein n=1 Tax=Streptomyces sp. 3214.6 TaxID=1882757 RepID=UPI00090B2BAA|nr:hypothetical protein [Streptomyces sp. 3214.6]SHI00306.1 Metal-dependent hydrolase, beta-lactamase superfamily II [Streptomyces sp. 3214.6]